MIPHLQAIKERALGGYKQGQGNTQEGNILAPLPSTIILGHSFSIPRSPERFHDVTKTSLTWFPFFDPILPLNNFRIVS
jgi:hypothetical protein